MKKELNIKELEKLFQIIGDKLEKKTEVFMIGGGAMCFRNQKNATKDLDLVFLDKKDCDVFSNAIEEVGFKREHLLGNAYEMMKADGVFRDSDEHRLDIFYGNVCGALKLSRNIVNRSEPLGVFGNLSVKIVSNEDVILFKGITERPDDSNDIATIVRTSMLDWGVILEECKKQSRNRDWTCVLYDKFEDIKKTHGIDPPITKEIWKMCSRRMIKDSYKQYRKEGKTREEALKHLKKMGFSKKEIEKSIQ